MFNIDLDLNRIKMFYEDNQKTVRMAALIIVVGLSILFFWIRGDSRTHVIGDAETDTETESETETESITETEPEAETESETETTSAAE